MKLFAYLTEKLQPTVATQQLAEQYARYIMQHFEIEYFQSKDDINQDTLQTIEHIIQEMVYDHKPLAYCLGSAPFLDLILTVKPPTLIPRQETEQICDWIREHYKQKPPKYILDIGTGTGCIALSIAKKFPESSVIATDISPQAITLAQQNAAQNNITNVTFQEVSLIPKELQQVDLIISNPPYLSQQEWEELDPSVKEWEDKQALVADNDGLALYQAIITHAVLLGKPDIVFEFGIPEQAPKLKALFHSAGYLQVVVYNDLYERNRWIHATNKC